MTTIDRAAIQAAYIRLYRLYMCKALFRSDHVGTRARQGRVAIFTREPGTAHACGQVDDDIRIIIADAFDDITEQIDAACALAGFRIAHMDVSDGGSGLGC